MPTLVAPLSAKYTTAVPGEFVTVICASADVMQVSWAGPSATSGQRTVKATTSTGQEIGPFENGTLVTFTALSGSPTYTAPGYQDAVQALVSGAGIAPVTLESRGDSLTVGFGLTDLTKVYGARFASAFNLPLTNYGANGSGTLAQYSAMVAGTSRPRGAANGSTNLTLWLQGFNDMRSGVSASRLAAFRGVAAAGMLLTVAKWSGLRGLYNGNLATYFGAPASSFALSGGWGIGNYGVNGQWRGVTQTTNGATATATVQGNVVYVIYCKRKTTTGGTFSVSIDGTVVLPSVSCDGTGLALEASDTTSADASGYMTLLRIPTSPGQHTVLVTVTSATGASNLVHIEAIAGNADCIGNALVVGACPRMNATGYAGSAAAYGSAAIGDAAVYQYQQVQLELVEQFRADGFNVKFADTSRLFAVSPNVQADNIHFTETGQGLIFDAFSDSYRGIGKADAQPSPGDVLTVAVPASLTAYKNASAVCQEVFLTGGTVTAVEFLRDGSSWIQATAGTPASVWLNPSDSVRVTYTVAPTMNVVPR